jgi:hypothetical protein
MSVSHDMEFREDVIEIVKLCLEVNRSLKEATIENDLKSLLELFESDFYSFIEKVNERDSEYRFSPFWVEFDFNKIVSTIRKLDNEQIWKFGHYFNSRYGGNIFEMLNREKSFVIKLREHIDKPKAERKRKSLRNASLDYLSNCLAECEKKFPSSC